MCNAAGHGWSCACGFGGDTRSGTGTYATATATARSDWRGLTEHRPLSHPTTCWWCGESVFFHRDENGGRALLDYPLGRPWKVHGCWLDYQADQNSALHHVASRLEAASYNGIFYPPTIDLTVRPEADELDVTIQGFVSDNRILYDGNPTLQIQSAKRATSAISAEIDISDKDKRFRFVVPRDIAERLADYELVRASGRWRKRKRRWFLIATEITRLTVHSDLESKSYARTDSLFHCHFCGNVIEDGEAWGFDPAYNLECGRCGQSRGCLRPEEFIQFCGRVTRNGRKRRT